MNNIDKSKLNLSEEDCDYKSCFARSVAVNAQYKLTKYLDHERRSPEDKIGGRDDNNMDMVTVPKSLDVIGVKKSPSSPQNNQKLCTFLNGITRISTNNRITYNSEIPVENMVHHSKVATLQWQLKEAEKSRAMYKDVMKEVVTFLERVHHSLDSLSSSTTRINSNKRTTVSRSKSEHQIMGQENGLDHQIEDYSTFHHHQHHDFTGRRRPKKQGEHPDEISPEKLAQEAFRLLRTAQSLLNTQEPNLVQNIEEDAEFLNQLAREFPQSPNKPQRTTSFSLSPKLIMPETETRISTAFNRKLSLQLNETRQISKTYTICSRHTTNNFKSNNDHHFSLLGNLIDDETEINQTIEKSNSPPSSSISSVEAESGFSSMNSFQDVGLPKIVDNSICSNDEGVFINESSIIGKHNENDIKLWQTYDNNNVRLNHKRYSSTPVKINSNPIWV